MNRLYWIHLPGPEQTQEYYSKTCTKMAETHTLPLVKLLKQGMTISATTFDSYGGLVKNPYTSRYYYNGGVAPHVLGYMSSIPAEDN